MAGFGAHGPKGAMLFLALWIWAVVPSLARIGGGAAGVLGWVLLVGGGLVLAAVVTDELHGVVLGMLAFPGLALGSRAGVALELPADVQETARLAGGVLLPGLLTLGMLAFVTWQDRRAARRAAATADSMAGTPD